MVGAGRLYLGLTLLAACAFQLTKAQKLDEAASHGAPAYHSSQNHNYVHEPYEQYDEDERPKVRVGIRLRIPAMKIDLPRFNMPKITVNARIRQPDRPRVINLPEINLDTTSKVEPPTAKHHHRPTYHYDGGHHSHHNQDTQNVQQYSFSAQSYQTPAWAQYYNQQPIAYRGQQSYIQQPMVQAKGYHQHRVWDRPALKGTGAYGTASTQTFESFRSLQEADVGFDEPVQQSYGQRSKRTITEGMRQPKRFSVLRKLMRIK